MKLQIEHFEYKPSESAVKLTVESFWFPGSWQADCQIVDYFAPAKSQLTQFYVQEVGLKWIPLGFAETVCM